MKIHSETKNIENRSPVGEGLSKAKALRQTLILRGLYTLLCHVRFGVPGCPLLHCYSLKKQNSILAFIW